MFLLKTKIMSYDWETTLSSTVLLGSVRNTCTKHRGSWQQTSVKMSMSSSCLVCQVIVYNITKSLKTETISSNTNSFTP